MDLLTRIAQFSTVETERLYLRPFRFGDSTAFHQITGDPENLAFIFPVAATRAESDYLLTHAFLKAPLGIWALEDKLSGELLGAIKFDKLDPVEKKGEIGYFVKKTFQGQGIATEALKNLCYLSFQEFGLKRLTIITHVENVASQQVAKKAGFTLSRQYKGSDRYTHKMRTYFEFELSRTNYE